MCITASLISSAQSITAAEYFFDEDPSAGKGKSLSVGTTGTSVHFSTSLATIGLSAGFHSLSIRAMTSNSKWGLFESRSFYISQNSVDTVANITSAEYFFDEDPGAGKGKPLQVATADTTVHFVVALPTTGLKGGFHTLSIRTKNASGNWSLFESRSFFVSPSGTGTLANITAAEYFFDNDPGAGKGTALSIGTAGTSVHLVATIPDSAFQPGFHVLSIRAKNINGTWGLFESRSFYVSQNGSDTLAYITQAEYFFDEDPGTGKGKPLTVGTAGRSVHFIASLPTTGLRTGFHTLSIRAMTSPGTWSLFESRSFYVSPSGSNLLTKITAAEYYFDVDPGFGKGKPLSVGTADTSVHFTVSIPTTLTVPFRGNRHFLVIRVKDSTGKWSLYEMQAFTFAPTDKDRDGLVDYDEPPYGTNYLIFDTNGDDLADGVNVFTGLNPISTDTDGDSLTNAQEVLMGTSPILADTDGDGVPDKLDPFPLDRFRTVLPPANPTDHTKPVITLKQPF